jgi:hypothetical protein
MDRTVPALIAVLILALAGHAPADDVPKFAPNADFFENKVRPILAEHCYSCHGPDKQKGGLRLDTITDIKKGADTGPLFVAGKPDASLLLQVTSHTGEIRMPPKAKLPNEALRDLTTWVREGAVLPAEKAIVAEAWKSHWAFQPVNPPTARAGQNPIDALITQRLRTTSLEFAPPADRRTLLRRAKFDLLGLPPTYEEAEAFIADATSDDVAFGKVLDRYLALPHFGERWARHWLDLARYADNKGYIGVGVDRTYPYAWTYRDWVVNAFNQDMPYDRFLVCQLAADQLDLKDDKRDLAAMGFLTVGRRFINNIHDIIDDRIDVTTRTMLGLTVQCARCHDHKYDPIPAADYYSLYGVFNSSREPDLEDQPLLGMKRSEVDSDAFEKELKRLKDELAKWEKDHEADKKDKPRKFEEERKPFENKIKKLHADHPGAPPRGMVLLDKPKPSEPRIFLRGNPGKPGPKVTRHFVSFLAPDNKPAPFKKGSGRLELAQAIVYKDNPLTARVWANRVWSHLIGRPLVHTPSDFGLRSDPPTHPELLDHLAHQLVKDGWSTKKLIRTIMLSRAYRQSSDSEASSRLDPENKYMARMNRKRLEWEPQRDSLLAVSGRLDLTLGGPSVDLTRKDLPRRTLYAFIDRQNLPGLYRTFDFAIPDTHSPQRFTTTVAQQALYFLNSGFVNDQAKALLNLPEVKNATDPTERLHRLYHRAFARDAEPHEVELAKRYLGEKPNDRQWQRLTQAFLMTNEFVFVD